MGERDLGGSGLDKLVKVDIEWFSCHYLLLINEYISKVDGVNTLNSRTLTLHINANMFSIFTVLTG